MAKRIKKTVETAVESATLEQAVDVKLELEVIGNMEDLIAGLGSVEAALESAKSPAQQAVIGLFEANEDGSKGARIGWEQAKVVSFDLNIKGERRKVWQMVGDRKVLDALCSALEQSGVKYFNQSLEQALTAYKRRQDQLAAEEAARPAREAAQAASAEVFKTLDLNRTGTDNSPWCAMEKITEERIVELLTSRFKPVGREKDEEMQTSLTNAAGLVLEFLDDLKAAIAAKGNIKNAEQFADVLAGVKAAWTAAEKVPPYVMDLRLVTRQFRGATFGCIVQVDDVKSFVAEMDNQFITRQAELKSSAEKAGRSFMPAKRPSVEVRDPAQGCCAWIVYFAEREESRLAEFAAKEAARLEALAAAKAKEEADKAQAAQTFLGGLAARLRGQGIESVDDLRDLAVKGNWKRQGKREKGDRRHGKRA